MLIRRAYIAGERLEGIAGIMTPIERVIRMHRLQQTAAPASAAKSASTELKEQIRQTIIDASDAAREAGSNGVRPAIATLPPHAPGGGFTVQNGGFDPDGIPPQVVDISIAFFVMCAVIVIGWPIARAFGKRLEHRTEMPAMSTGMSAQLQRIEQTVDAMSIEIERISESQRFMAKLLSAQKPELKGVSG